MFQSRLELLVYLISCLIGLGISLQIRAVSTTAFFCHFLSTEAAVLYCKTSGICRNYTSVVWKKGKISHCYRKGRDKKTHLQSRIVVSQSSGLANRRLMLGTDYKSISDSVGQIVNHHRAKSLKHFQAKAGFCDCALFAIFCEVLVMAKRSQTCNCHCCLVLAIDSFVMICGWRAELYPFSYKIESHRKSIVPGPLNKGKHY